MDKEYAKKRLAELEEEIEKYKEITGYGKSNIDSISLPDKAKLEKAFKDIPKSSQKEYIFTLKFKITEDLRCNSIEDEDIEQDLSLDLVQYSGIPLSIACSIEDTINENIMDNDFYELFRDEKPYSAAYNNMFDEVDKFNCLTSDIFDKYNIDHDRLTGDLFDRLEKGNLVPKLKPKKVIKNAKPKNKKPTKRIN